MKLKISAGTEKEYVARKGLVCPNCGGSALVADDNIVVDEGGITQESACEDCGAVWKDFYALAGILDRVIEVS